MPSRTPDKIVLAWSGGAAQSCTRSVPLTQAYSPVLRALGFIGARGGRAFWHNQLLTALKSARIRLLCLTAGNVDSTWIHFEAGAIANRFGSPCACPYLLNVDWSGFRAGCRFCSVSAQMNTGHFGWSERSTPAWALAALSRTCSTPVRGSLAGPLGTLHVIADEEIAGNETHPQETMTL